MPAPACWPPSPLPAQPPAPAHAALCVLRQPPPSAAAAALPKRHATPSRVIQPPCSHTTRAPPPHRPRHLTNTLRGLRRQGPRHAPRHAPACMRPRIAQARTRMRATGQRTLRYALRPRTATPARSRPHVTSMVTGAHKCRKVASISQGQWRSSTIRVPRRHVPTGKPRRLPPRVRAAACTRGSPGAVTSVSPHGARWDYSLLGVVVGPLSMDSASNRWLVLASVCPVVAAHAAAATCPRRCAGADSAGSLRSCSTALPDRRLPGAAAPRAGEGGGAGSTAQHASRVLPGRSRGAQRCGCCSRGHLPAAVCRASGARCAVTGAAPAGAEHALAPPGTAAPCVAATAESRTRAASTRCTVAWGGRGIGRQSEHHTHFCPRQAQAQGAWKQCLHQPARGCSHLAAAWPHQTHATRCEGPPMPAAHPQLVQRPRLLLAAQRQRTQLRPQRAARGACGVLSRAQRLGAARGDGRQGGHRQQAQRSRPGDIQPTACRRALCHAAQAGCAGHQWQRLQ